MVVAVVRWVIGMAIKLYQRLPYGYRFDLACGRVLSIVHRWAPAGPIVATSGGNTFEVFLSEAIDANIYYAGSYEPDVGRCIGSVLKPGMVAMDVGANIGYHTIGMARRVGESGSVIAIEPTSWAMKRLRRHVELNALPNVKLLNIAVGEHDLGPVKTRFRSSFRLDGKDVRTEEIINIMRLDTLVDGLELRQLDFMKVDVDGYDVKVFKGARRLLERYHPMIVFELCPALTSQNGDDYHEAISLMVAAGYSIRTAFGAELKDVHSYCSGRPPNWYANLLAIPRVQRKGV